MLKLQYLLADSCSQPPNLDADSLGTVTFSALNKPLRGTDLIAATPCLHAEIAYESWRFASKMQIGSTGALHYRYCDELLLGHISLDETRFPGDSERSALQRATAAAYQEIFTLLDRLQYAHLWRVWNFIPRINEIEHGLERYRQFNIDRQAVFAANGRTIAGNVPAASAVGTANGNLTLYFIAGRNAPLAIENPRQTASYHYPAEYGPRTPVFARASAVTCAGEDLLFISGTASIVGHRTLHENNVVAQTRELLANIDSLLAASSELSQRRKFARSDLVYKVYVRHPTDFVNVKTEIERWLGAVPDAIYLKADICRSELLVEVEASAGHSKEIISENSEYMRT